MKFRSKIFKTNFWKFCYCVRYAHKIIF